MIDNMAKRHTELSTDVVMNFRINAKMKGVIDKQADMAGISSAEWMRRVLQEKIDSISTQKYDPHDAHTSVIDTNRDELRECVREILIEILNERKIKM